MVKPYTGIGSRRTPPHVLEDMRCIGVALANTYGLRTGGAEGADTAFADGAIAFGGPVCIYRPEAIRSSKGVVVTWGPPSKEAYAVAESVHPAWGSLGDYAKALHARNVHQVLGPKLNAPSEFLVCWTPDGASSEEETSRSTGGTRTAIVVACRNGIPVFNLHEANTYSDALARLERICRKSASLR